MAHVLALAAFVGLWLAPAMAQIPLPPLTARVTDLTDTLRPHERRALDERLAGLEAQTGAQLVILMLPTVEPETIEQFGIRLAEAWQIGRRGVDDGLILIVAKEDRAVRLEVGYGLEGVIPDAVAKRVIEEHIVPRFRQGDFYGGLSAGVEALAARLAGEPLTAPSSPAAAGVPLEFAAAAMSLAILLRFVFGALGKFLVALIFAAYVYWLTASWLATVLAFFIVLMAQAGASGKRWHTGTGSFPRGGRSGGFSGGGGRFGGGGASGRW